MRINCAANLPAHLQQILFALDAAFVFLFDGLGGEHLLSWTICLGTQAREEWGKETWREKRVRWGNGTGRRRRRWSKTVMDKQKVTDWDVGKKLLEVGSQHHYCGCNFRESRTYGTLWLLMAKKWIVFHVYISTLGLVYTTDPLHLTSLDWVPKSWCHLGGNVWPQLANMSFFLCAKVILVIYLIL